MCRPVGRADTSRGAATAPTVPKRRTVRLERDDPEAPSLSSIGLGRNFAFFFRAADHLYNLFWQLLAWSIVRYEIKTQLVRTGSHRRDHP